MDIITNNRARPLQSFLDLPVKARADFDYIGGADWFDLRFVQYKGAWYDVADVQAIRTAPGAPVGLVVDKDSPLASWSGIQSETFFSGVLFKWVNDYDVIVGRYYY